mmetsp:Transcript_2166/g.3004  ORF Transcript_2166/g.3004 Transcript_2166/m.3004 type:complete len:266 (-) Transcript_2166:1092-1889(-)
MSALNKEPGDAPANIRAMRRSMVLESSRCSTLRNEWPSTSKGMSTNQSLAPLESEVRRISPLTISTCIVTIECADCRSSLKLRPRLLSALLATTGVSDFAWVWVPLCTERMKQRVSVMTLKKLRPLSPVDLDPAPLKFFWRASSGRAISRHDTRKFCSSRRLRLRPACVCGPTRLSLHFTATAFLTCIIGAGSTMGGVDTTGDRGVPKVVSAPESLDTVCDFSMGRVACLLAGAPTLESSSLMRATAEPSSPITHTRVSTAPKCG